MRYSSKLLLVILLLSSVALLIIAIFGVFIRPIADDLFYLSAGSHEPYKLFDFRLNGRLSSLFIYGLLYSIPILLKLVPAITIALAVGAIYTISRHSLKKFTQNDLGLLSLTISTTLTLCIFIMTPSLYTNLYWLSSAPVHVWSFCLILFYLYFLLTTKKYNNPLYIFLLYFIFPLFISLMYETAAFIVLLANLSFIAYYYVNTRSINIKFLTGILASILGVVYLVASQSSKNRQEAYATSTGASSLDRVYDLPAILWNNITFITPSNYRNISILILCLVAGILISLFYIKAKSISNRLFFLILTSTALAGLLAPLLNISLIWIATGHSVPPLRVYFFSSLCYILSSFVVGLLIGAKVGSQRIEVRWFIVGFAVSAALSTLLYNSLYINHMRHQLGLIKNHAVAWDSRDAYIKKRLHQQPCIFGVKNLPIEGIQDLALRNDQNNKWLNDAITYYYYGEDSSQCLIYKKEIVQQKSN